MSRPEVLSKSIAGTAIKLTSTNQQTVHELEKNKTKERIFLVVSNKGASDAIVEIHYNGQLSEVTVPGHDTRNYGPFVLHGSASDDTAISNKALSLKAPVADEILVHGEVQD